MSKEQKARSLEGQYLMRTDDAFTSYLDDLITSAQRALTYQDVGHGDHQERIKVAPITKGDITLSDAVFRDLRAIGLSTTNIGQVPQQLSISGVSRALDPNTGSGLTGGHKVEMSTAFDLAQTHTATGRAGARVMDFPAPKGHLLRADVAEFGPLDASDNAPEWTEEAFGDFAKWDIFANPGEPNSVPAYGVEITATRRLEKLVGRDAFMKLMTHAISLGAINAIDRIALERLTSVLPVSGMPSLAQMATSGIDSPSNVRAIGGTGEHGLATFDPHTGPHFGGIAMPSTSKHLGDAAIVGDWSTLVLMTNPTLDIRVNRMNTRGDVKVVAFIDVLPVIEDAGRLYRVSAEV